MSKISRTVITGTVVLLFLSIATQCARAQSDSGRPQPYASIASKGVEYSGPGRDPEYDLTGSTVSIGLVVPLSGPRKSDGEAIVIAAKMALADAEKESLPSRRKLVLVTGDESGPSWSGVTAALTHLVFDEQAIAIITSSSGATAHLSEQVANRIGVPVLTLASDKTTTQIDLPWIFRIGPTDSLEARTIADGIYRDRGLKRVLLVTENDHDGRRGLSEFQDAARAFNAQVPDSLVLDSFGVDGDVFMEAVRLRAPEAIVLWTKAFTAMKLLEVTRCNGTKMPIYLPPEDSRGIPGIAAVESRDRAPSESDLWTVATVGGGSQIQDDFASRFLQATGESPSSAAAEAYDAVRLVALAFRKAGPNRARVRDEIARTKNWQGASGMISFDSEGNNAVTIRLVQVPVIASAAELTRRD